MITKDALKALRACVKGRGKKMQVVGDQADLVALMLSLGEAGAASAEPLHEVWFAAAGTRLGDAACDYLHWLGQDAPCALRCLLAAIDDGRFAHWPPAFFDYAKRAVCADGGSILARLHQALGDGTGDRAELVLPPLIWLATTDEEVARAIAQDARLAAIVAARARAGEERAAELISMMERFGAEPIDSRTPMPISDLIDRIRSLLPEQDAKRVHDVDSAAEALEECARSAMKVVGLLSKIMNGPYPALTEVARTAADRMGPHLSLESGDFL